MNTQTATDWREVKIHFGKKNGTRLGDLSPRDLKWWKDNWFPNPRFNSEPDKILRAALDSATIEPSQAQTNETTGSHVGTVGEKITLEVTVVEKFDFETEFNRKKVVQEVAILMDSSGNKLKWKTQNLPPEVQVGEVITITGTVKEHSEFKDERVTSLKLCKVSGAVKITPTHRIALFCDGKSSADRIAVCAGDGALLWCGSAGIGRPDNGDNTDHELAGALKALEIAEKVRLAANVKYLAVELNYDAKWMGGMVGKAKPIRDYAKAHNLIVTMTHIAGTSNPADEYTVIGGEQSFGGDFASLAAAI